MANLLKSTDVDKLVLVTQVENALHAIRNEHHTIAHAKLQAFNAEKAIRDAAVVARMKSIA